MNHAFNTDVAKEYGMKEAVLIANFQFWLKKNAEDKRNEHDGRFWTYNTMEVIADSFPYLTLNEVRRGIDSLIKAGVLLKANYNRAAYDQTRWYAFNDQQKWLLSEEKAPQASETTILQNCQIELAELPNPFGEIAKPIPDTNPNTKPDIKNSFSSYPAGAEKIESVLVLTAEQQEVFDWAATHTSKSGFSWCTATTSIETFLHVFNFPNGKLKAQFDAHKKAQHATKQTGLFSEIHCKTTGGNYASNTKFNQYPRLSPAERVRKANGLGEYAPTSGFNGNVYESHVIN
jgi:hypothetical protein